MLLSSVVAFSVLALAASTDVHKCPEKSNHLVHSEVQITPCKRLPCRLKKGTDEHISIEFTPAFDLTEVKNEVGAQVLGLQLPFIGVDGNSICDKVFTESGEKTSCPLIAGTKYVYKDKFPILAFYPLIDVKVHWSLRSGDKDIVCFEVPAKIVN